MNSFHSFEASNTEERDETSAKLKVEGRERRKLDSSPMIEIVNSPVLKRSGQIDSIVKKQLINLQERILPRKIRTNSLISVDSGNSYTNKMAEYKKKVFHLLQLNLSLNRRQVLPKNHDFEDIVDSILSDCVNDDSTSRYALWDVKLCSVMNYTSDPANVIFLQEKYRSLVKSIFNFNKFKKRNRYISASLDGISAFSTVFSSTNSRLATKINLKAEKMLHEEKKMSRLADKQAISQMILPHGTFRKTWDFCVMVLVIYNLVSIPLNFLENKSYFHLTSSDFIELTTDIVFFFDICFNFITGYKDSRNNVVTDTKKVITNYATGLLALDIVSILPLDVVASRNYSLLANLLKLGRLSKFKRVSKSIPSVKGSRVAKLVCLATSFVIISLWLGCFAVLLIESKSVFDFVRLQEKETCFRKHSGESNTLCRVNMSVFFGFSFVLNEDIEMYDYGFLWYLASITILVKIAVSILMGNLSNTIDDMNSHKNKEEMVNIQIEQNLKSLGIEQYLIDEVKVQFCLKLKEGPNLKHLLGNSVFSKSLKQKIIAHRYFKLMRKLSFYTENLFDDRVIGDFLEILKENLFLRGDVIFFKEAAASKIYFLESGKVEQANGNIMQSIPSENDRVSSNELYNMKPDKIRAFLERDAVERLECFDLISFFSKAKRHWSTAFAVENSTVLSIDNDNLNILFGKHPSLHDYLLQKAKQKLGLFGEDQDKIMEYVRKPTYLSTRCDYRKNNLNVFSFWKKKMVPTLCYENLKKNLVECDLSPSKKTNKTFSSFSQIRVY